VSCTLGRLAGYDLVQKQLANGELTQELDLS
jgi:hypothetical protein